MPEKIRIVPNRFAKNESAGLLDIVAETEIEKALRFHRSIPEYAETPLVRLDALAAALGVKAVCVKDESHRFGLNAFKALGGSYAIAHYIAERTGRDISEMDYSRLVSAETRQEAGQTTFFTATDGNHGRGVAWAANRLGQKAVVYMPKGSTKARLENIRAEGAEASIIDGNYDDAVRLAAAESAKLPGSVVVQDTAWPGYEEIPRRIMQGYGTMTAEAATQMAAAGLMPTHIFIQAGVGSLAGAVAGYFAAKYGESAPAVTVAEPTAADCLFKSAEALEYRTVGGDMATIMAGLACGEPNTVSFEILKNTAAFFASCPDWVSAKGMRMLSSPLKGDARVISGESGAVGLGLLASLSEENRRMMGIDENSVVLLFSTEGDTDPDMYRDIIWNGAYGSYGL